MADSSGASDEDLAREAQAGSLSSFEELVKRYEARLCTFLSRACRNDADGADLTQETFVTAYTKLNRFDPEQSFETWVFTIARRKCVDHLRARKRLSEESVPQGVDEENPFELAAREDERSDLWARAREILTEVEFQALWLRYVEDLSVEETARVLDRTRTHIKVILFRARTKLAEKLEGFGTRAGVSRRVSAFRSAEGGINPNGQVIL